MIIQEGTNKKVSGRGDVVKILTSILASEDEIDRDKEHFWVIGLTTRNGIKYIELATLGVLDQSVIHPREVFRMAIMKGVKSIVVAHNHPSGDPSPSREDVAITDKLQKAGEILYIEVRDSLIIAADGRSYSITECVYNRPPKGIAKVTAAPF